jgi:chemotaxis-related protein WspB
MQLLTFSIAGEPYAIEARLVIEVLPLVPARPIPQVPEYVLGIFTYRGDLVPLVDLGRRLGSGPPLQRLSTRVIVVEFRPGLLSPGDSRRPDEVPLVRLGLVAENVIAIRGAEEAEASLPPLQLAFAPYLGQVLRLGGGTVQMIDVTKLLPAELLTGLCPASSPQPEGQP